MFDISFTLTIIFTIIYLVTTLNLFLVLHKRGEQVNFFLIPIKLFSYASRYKDITIKETGSTGWIYYTLYISYALAIASLFSMLVTASMQAS